MVRATAHKVRLWIPLVALLCAILGLAPAKYSQASSSQSGVSQVQQDPRPFGSSLKRLHWDKRQGAAVEAVPKSRRGPSNGSDEFKLSTLLVTLDVLVTDPTTGKPVSGLSRNDFSLTEDGKSQTIASASPGDDVGRGRRMVLLIDLSGSERAYVDSSVEAAHKLVRDLAPLDRMAIVTDDVELVSGFTSDKSALDETLEKIRRRALNRLSRSLQFTALFAALRELSGASDQKTIVIFQTDGDEAPTFRDQPDAKIYESNMPRREYGLKDIYAALSRSSATVYSIIPGQAVIGLPEEQVFDRVRQILTSMERARFRSEAAFDAYDATHPLTPARVRLWSSRIVASQMAATQAARLTGGWTSFLESPGQAESIYARILADINNRYLVSYYPENNLRDGSQRTVHITVPGHSDYLIQSRTSYVAPRATDP